MFAIPLLCMVPCVGGVALFQESAKFSFCSFLAIAVAVVTFVITVIILIANMLFVNSLFSVFANLEDLLKCL